MKTINGVQCSQAPPDSPTAAVPGSINTVYFKPVSVVKHFGNTPDSNMLRHITKWYIWSWTLAGEKRLDLLSMRSSGIMGHEERKEKQPSRFRLVLNSQSSCLSDFLEYWD